VRRFNVQQHGTGSGLLASPGAVADAAFGTANSEISRHFKVAGGRRRVLTTR
jgi:hypothetical protein